MGGVEKKVLEKEGSRNSDEGSDCNEGDGVSAETGNEPAIEPRRGRTRRSAGGPAPQQPQSHLHGIDASEDHHVPHPASSTSKGGTHHQYKNLY